MSHGKSTLRSSFSYSLTNLVVIKYCEEHEKAYVDRVGFEAPHISMSNTSGGTPDDGPPECHHCHDIPLSPSLPSQDQGFEGKIRPVYPLYGLAKFSLYRHALDLCRYSARRTRRNGYTNGPGTLGVPREKSPQEYSPSSCALLKTYWRYLLSFWP